MNTEFIIDVNGTEACIYMMTGFFNHRDMSSPMHKHSFIEMHILLSGEAVLTCDDVNLPLVEGDAVCVPANMLHTYHSYNKESKRITFFIKYDVSLKEAVKRRLSGEVLTLLCEEIREYVLNGFDGKLKPLLSYICCDFFASRSIKPLSPLTNRELIIDEFFSKSYNSGATVQDLARLLMLSCKQTEREVKRVTGNTFAGEMAHRKIGAALILSQTTDLPLTKISELVGYSSYSGFYKAYKRMAGGRLTADEP